MSPEEEAQRILELVHGDLLKGARLIEAQLNVLQTRTQILLTLAGAVITVTGFSGRLIAGTSLLGRVSVISGLAVVIASAVWVFLSVMRIHWVSSQLADEPHLSLTRLIIRRNRKTRAYRIGGTLLCVGLAIYGTAVSIMLAN